MTSNSLAEPMACFSSARKALLPRKNITTRIVELLWTDGQVMDSFRRNGRGWQSVVASRLGVSRSDLTTYISAVGGIGQIRRYVFGNPAGVAPAVEPALSQIPQHMAASWGCPSDHGCPSSGCPSAHCGTYMCGSYQCADRSPHPGSIKPDVA